MDSCPFMETDSGRSLLAWLVVVYSGAIRASDNHTLSYSNVETPTNTFRATWDTNLGRTSLCTSNDLHHKIVDHRAERVASVVRRSLGQCLSPISSQRGQAAVCSFLEKLGVNNSSALNNWAKLPSAIQL